jgi:hypothetical protein
MRKKVVDDPYLWIKKEGGAKAECESGYHRAPAYAKFYNPDKYCVRDCGEWKTPRRNAKKGACGRPRGKSLWLTGLLTHWKQTKEIDKDYTYTQAMQDFSEIYKGEKDKSFFSS